MHIAYMRAYSDCILYTSFDKMINHFQPVRNHLTGYYCTCMYIYVNAHKYAVLCSIGMNYPINPTAVHDIRYTMHRAVKPPEKPVLPVLVATA